MAPHLAFLFTGMPWFDQDIIRELLDHEQPPLKQGYLEFSPDNSSTPRFVDQQDGPLTIWKLPETSLRYSLGMDVGEGIGADYTVIQVVCNDTR